MDILNSVKSMMGGDNENKDNSLISTVIGLISSQGGLNGILSKFNSKGLGDVVSSWIGTGNNMPVSPDQIQDVLGRDQINEAAAKLGEDPSVLKSKISDVLPQVVDKLTPEGKVPDDDNLLSKGMEMLGGFFGKKD